VTGFSIYEENRSNSTMRFIYGVNSLHEIWYSDSAICGDIQF